MLGLLRGSVRRVSDFRREPHSRSVTITVIVTVMTRPRDALRAFRSPTGRWAAAFVVAVPLLLAGCSSHDDRLSAPSSPSGSSSASGSSAAEPVSCPTPPISVVVSVDQWGDIVSQLGGSCADVKTVLSSSSVDPHDYEPSPADAASFAGAQLIVLNGDGYDQWASKLAATSAPGAPVVSATEVTKTAQGANPHLWYSPAAVTSVADAVTAELAKLSPDAVGYFGAQRTAFAAVLEPYDELIAKVKASAAGKTYAATENVFYYQAQALGLVDKTPEGYRNSSANDSDPSPADLEAFQRVLAERGVDVLIYNTQTEGSIPEQIRAAAQKAGVPVVDITETVPPGQTSFVDWQDDQLTALAKALGVPA